MILWHPEPPQGFSVEQELVTIGRPTIPRFASPQSRITEIREGPLLAIYPPIADNTYQFYKFYQINKDKVPSAQTNMPIVIVDSLGNGIIAEASGNDVRVFDSDGNAIPYETILSGIDGNIIIWLKPDVIADLEFVQLTFGKLTATDGSTPNLVYPINYKAVYHLNGNGIDSTLHTLDLTVNGTTTVPALIGDGLSFPGNTSNYLHRQPFDEFPSGDISAQYVIQTSGSGDGMFSYAIGSGVLANHFLLFMQGDFDVYINGSEKNTGIAFNDGSFHVVTVTWRQSDGQLIVYIDGIPNTPVFHNPGVSHVNGGSLVLGQDQDTLGGGFGNGSQSLNGILQEVHLSDIVRSSDYIKTQANNMLDNAAFWFKTPLLTNGENNFLVDDMGRNILAVAP